MKFTKKSLTGLLCSISLAVFTLCSTVPAADTFPIDNPVTEKNNVLLGDVDQNGVVNSIDLAKYRLYLLGILKELPLDDGDIDKNGSINSLDFAACRKYVLGMIDLPTTNSQVKTDDWNYSPNNNLDMGGMPSPGIPAAGGLTGGFNSPVPLPMATAGIITGSSSGGSLGFSTGGAKDINNFRENINNNYFPQYSSLTYEGLFYDYYFDTGKQETTDKLFSPSYTYAVSADPISGESEYYLSVGLNSGMKEEDFKRKKLNLTIVLDISGSMSSPFDSYYYDNTTSESELADKNKNKLQIANESIVNLIGHLNDDDRFGMVLFDGSAYLAKPLNLVGKTDMDAIKNHVLELTPQGSTNFEAGYKMGTSLYDAIEDYDPDEYENRIIFLTDAMPNVGNISEDSLLGLTTKNSTNKIYTTFIGIGVDFNTDLIENITKTRGANYYSVHSPKEFKTRMDDEFEYMVTPLVFNLQLNLESEGYKIEKVYGSPEANESTGELMKVNTLFPAKSTNEGTKGGLVLLKLKKISEDAELKLTTSYEDRNGKADKDTVSVTFEDKEPDFYQNSGIRKGIVLSRYANLIKNWLANEAVKESPEPIDIIPLPIVITRETGIIVPDDQVYLKLLSKWEQKSVPLQVSQEFKDLFKEFIPYFESEMESIGDDTMSKELEILEKLCNYQEN